jgi:hypothetical protein
MVSYTSIQVLINCRSTMHPQHVGIISSSSPSLTSPESPLLSLLIFFKLMGLEWRARGPRRGRMLCGVVLEGRERILRVDENVGAQPRRLDLRSRWIVLRYQTWGAGARRGLSKGAHIRSCIRATADFLVTLSGVAGEVKFGKGSARGKQVLTGRVFNRYHRQ